MEPVSATVSDHVFLRGGGEMGRLMRGHDWARTPLGPPERWPQSLRTAVRLLLTSRHPMFIWWGPELIQFYNDAYRETMGPERHPSALGGRGRACWEEIWPIIGPQIDLVMRGEGATWHEDQLVPVTRHGGLQNVWWTYGFSPIDEGGRVGGVLVVCRDVTDEHLVREALAETNERLGGDLARLTELFGQAPGFVAVLRGPDHVFEFSNAAYERLVGRRDLVGMRVRDILPEVEEQGFLALLDKVYASGKTHVGSGVAVHLLRQAERPNRQIFVDFVYQPILDASGKTSGIFIEGYDVTARIAAEQRQKLLMTEMNHRVKNTLSIVLSLAMLTGKASSSIEEFTSSLNGRLQAMVKTQDLLVRGEAASVDMAEILASELAPYVDAGNQIAFHAEPMMVRARSAVSLGLLLHELLSNAAKHGGLATADGRLEVRCERRGEGGVLLWRETAGRELAEARGQGFGMQLIEALARDVGGKADLRLGPGGLAAEITFETGSD